jgi:hypothetical protein
VISPSALAISRIIADPSININFRAALVPHYGPCDHGAVGPCALCQGPCESCGAQLKDGKAKHFPVSPERDRDGDLRCAVCLLDARHLDPEAEQAPEPVWRDWLGRAVSMRLEGDCEL